MTPLRDAMMQVANARSQREDSRAASIGQSLSGPSIGLRMSATKPVQRAALRRWTRKTWRES